MTEVTKREQVFDFIKTRDNEGATFREICSAFQDSINSKTVSSILSQGKKRGLLGIGDNGCYYIASSNSAKFKSKYTLCQNVVDVLTTHGPMRNADVLANLKEHKPTKGSLSATLSILKRKGKVEVTDGFWKVVATNGSKPPVAETLPESNDSKPYSVLPDQDTIDAARDIVRDYIKGRNGSGVSWKELQTELKPVGITDHLLSLSTSNLCVDSSIVYKSGLYYYIDPQASVKDSAEKRSDTRDISSIKDDINWLFETFVPKIMQENKDLWNTLERFGAKARAAKTLFESRRLE